MNLETFFEKFELFADAPGAVGKMRELILDLAVKGHLIPRDTAWVSRPLKSLTTKIGSGSTPSGGRESYFSDGVPLIRSMNVHFRGFDPTGLVYLNDDQAEKLSNVSVKPGDVLLNITGASIGRVTIAPPEMSGARVNQHVTIIRLKPEIFPRFLAIYLASSSAQRMINEIQVGATRQALTKGMIEQFEIPLPSLAEQKRIVEKVDELMALCDRLEVQQQEREAQHAALARSSLSRFADAPTSANLDFLFQDSYAIEPADIRKAILAMAVQGELIRADPNDEPAQELPVGKVVNFLGGFAFESPWFQKTPGIRLVRNQNIGHGNLNWSDTEYLPENLAADYERFRLYPGDLVLSLNRPFISTGLKIAWITDADCPCLLVQRVACLRPDRKRLLAEFLFLWCNAPHFSRDAHIVPSSGVPYIATNRVAKMTMRLPPLAEQRRIVARVDQLMALVDHLEATLVSSQATGRRLLEALLAELTFQD